MFLIAQMYVTTHMQPASHADIRQSHMAWLCPFLPLYSLQPEYLLHGRKSYRKGIHPVKVRAAASGHAGYMSAANAP